MLLSRKWLSDYIDLSGVSSDEIAQILTDLGLEVEEIKEEPALDDKLVIGKVLKTEPHPNADSLKVCEVDVGASEKISIVCGAPNAREGLFVACAQVGAVLPGNFKIKKSKIRSVPSFGMLCSEKELEISEEHDGIWEMADSSQIGQRVNEILDTSDSIFDISLTPNRADCLSYLGIARELSAKLGRELKMPEAELSVSSFKTSDLARVEVKDASACSRFVALAVKGVKAVSSPLWLVKALEKSGMRSVNLIVDLTNYVMLEQGQPVHAYDLRALQGGVIKAELLEKETSFKTLDDKTVQLLAGDIVIADEKSVLGVAGVMGGLDSEVKEDTTEILIEVAEFDPRKVRSTSKRLGLHTEASHRFERGVDVVKLPYVAKRLAALIQNSMKEAGLETPGVSEELCDIYPAPHEESKIALRLERARDLLALPHLETSECVKHLESLGLTLLDKKNERMLFSIPSWRHDLIREVDLIEEVARMVGFDKIPSELPRMNIQPNKESPLISFQDEARFVLASLGLSEVITYPFSGHKDYEKLLCKEDHPLWPRVELANALNEQEAWMQTSLVPSLLKAVLHNRSHGDEGSKLFELGRSYFETNSMSSASEKSSFFDFSEKPRYLETENEKCVFERNLVSGIFDSPLQKKSWNKEEVKPNFYTVKTLLEKFFQALNIQGVTWEVPSEGEYPFFHHSRSAKLVCGSRVLGFAGELHPRASHNLGLLGESSVLFELDLDRCLSVVSRKIEVQANSKKFPPVSRDFAFLVPQHLSFGEFKECVLKNPRKKNFESLEIFDVYEGEKVAEGFKSFAVRVIFRSHQKTLGDKEVLRESDFLVSWIEKELGAQQRS